MSDMHDNDTVDMARQASPGDMLRSERENQGLSVEEVATSLNLRPAVVYGLEKDDYAQVPVAAYRRGYLRAYARLLGIDEKGVLDAYRDVNGPTETERRVTPVKVAKPPSRIGAWLVKLVTLVVILGLAGLTLLWWQSRESSGLPGLGDNEPVAVDTLDGTPVTEEPAGVDANSADATAANSANGDTAVETAIDEEMPPLPAEDSDMGLTDGASATGAGQSSGTDTGAQATAANAQQAESASSTSENVATGSDSTEASNTSDAAGPDVLELSFNEQSWTEIFDANDDRIFVGLQSAGSSARAEGVPPFRLTIGNASGVELRYQGEAVDLGEYAGNNNVARFSLGE
ncbi:MULTISPECIES: RodZ domain-containing protein [Halomonadaceae]|uniref:Xre family transcriptional regulator n=1 Tax=Onishia taeanensis TaxID=284577 RepID=A0A328XMK1_9GAMM|nr:MULTISPECIES: RodZ domain-containing protein [Halomonas]RAR60939.1 Xre family transcriptional regulator [Halomonas taeanensis]